MATMRELKERINSVHSSQKITGAMKMISSARLRKAETALLQSQPYRRHLWKIYDHIVSSGCEYVSPLTTVRKVQRVAVVVYASDEGLCGAFNIFLYKKLVEVVRRYRDQRVREITVYPVGKKIVPAVRKLEGIQLGKYTDLFERKEYGAATRVLADELADGFLSGKYDRVDVIYTHFKSMGIQVAEERQFLPVVPEEVKNTGKREPWYIYEPDCKKVLQALYPLLLHASMYEMFIENRTSEQAARILAMQLANDNAAKLLGSLQLEYNKLRQQGITTELLDIMGGSYQN